MDRLQRRLQLLGAHLAPTTSAETSSAETVLDGDGGGAAPPLLGAEQLETFRHEGFVNAGPIFDDETLAELSDELDRVLAIGSDGLHGAVSFTPFGSSERPVIQIVNMWEASGAFARVCSHPKVIGIVRQLIGSDDILVWHDQMQYKPPYHGGVTGWHQDSPAWPIILPNHMLSAWLPLDDALVENGCMW